MSDKINTKFWSRVDTLDGLATDEDCWLWKGGVNSAGYGVLTLEDKSSEYAHRYSYTHYKGKFSYLLIILHSCNNKLCVNPSHLYAGTYKNNHDDYIKSGGKINVPSGWNTDLKAEDIQEIKRLHKSGMFQKEIAKLYKIGQPEISKIINNKRHCNTK